MKTMARLGQTAAAAGGFFAGYLWGVSHWARAVGGGGAELVRAALIPGGTLALGYALLAACLFWSCLPAPRVLGLRAMVAPAVFTLSTAAGFVGIRGALWFLGG
jgi:hypothetical protein